jgi:hypothetical protein
VIRPVLAIANYATLVIGIAVSGFLFNIARRLIFANKLESQKSAARVRSFWDALLGYGLVREDYLPDARMKSGLQYNKREKLIELNGRMSRGVFDRIFR